MIKLQTQVNQQLEAAKAPTDVVQPDEIITPPTKNGRDRSAKPVVN